MMLNKLFVQLVSASFLASSLVAIEKPSSAKPLDRAGMARFLPVYGTVVSLRLAQIPRRSSAPAEVSKMVRLIWQKNKINQNLV